MVALFRHFKAISAPGYIDMKGAAELFCQLGKMSGVIYWVSGSCPVDIQYVFVRELHTKSKQPFLRMNSEQNFMSGLNPGCEICIRITKAGNGFGSSTVGSCALARMFPEWSKSRTLRKRVANQSTSRGANKHFRTSFQHFTNFQDI